MVVSFCCCFLATFFLAFLPLSGGCSAGIAGSKFDWNIKISSPHLQSHQDFPSDCSQDHGQTRPLWPASRKNSGSCRSKIWSFDPPLPPWETTSGSHCRSRWPPAPWFFHLPYLPLPFSQEFGTTRTNLRPSFWPGRSDGWCDQSSHELGLGRASCSRLEPKGETLPAPSPLHDKPQSHPNCSRSRPIHTNRGLPLIPSCPRRRTETLGHEAPGWLHHPLADHRRKVAGQSSPLVSNESDAVSGIKMF